MPGDDGGGFFGEREAARYDELTADMFDPAVVAPTVDLLAELTAGGRALELGIGTGRIALPLAERGVSVAGIDSSEPMVARLREKPGAEDIDVAIGDFSTTRVDGEFALVYLVFNTIFNLKTQDAQVGCFQNAADHLAPGSVFVIENGVPDLQRLPFGDSIRVIGAARDRFSFDIYDVVTQKLTSQHFFLDGERVTSWPVEGRYVWPSELDLMARLAGLTLRDRWAGWNREPFTSVSEKHISVWEKGRADA